MKRKFLLIKAPNILSSPSPGSDMGVSVGGGTGVSTAFGVLEGFGVIVGRGVMDGFGVSVGTGVFVGAGIGVSVGRMIGVVVEMGIVVEVGIMPGVEVGGVPVTVEVGVLVSIGVTLEVGVNDWVGVRLGVGEVVPGRLVSVKKMEEAVVVGVLLGPVTGIRGTGVALSQGIGDAKKKKGRFVGVKKSLANASCVSTRSAGVTLAVPNGWKTTSSCRSTLSPDNTNGMPNARRQMTGMIRKITSPWE